MKVSTSPPQRTRRHQEGLAVIVVLALLAMILLYVTANLRTLDHVGKELKLIDQQQTRRLQAYPPGTNELAQPRAAGQNSIGSP